MEVALALAGGEGRELSEDEDWEHSQGGGRKASRTRERGWSLAEEVGP